MPTATAYGLSLWVSGWTGNIQVKIAADTLTVTPSGATSPARVVEDLIGDARAAWPLVTWGWSISAAGLVTLTATTAFQLLGSGNTPTRLGLTVPSSTLTSHTGTATAGLWGAWVTYADDYRRQGDDGESTYGGCSLIHTPSANVRTPGLDVLSTAAQAVAWSEAWDSMAYPGKVDVVQAGEVLTTYRASSWRSRVRGHAGHHDVTVELVR